MSGNRFPRSVYDEGEEPDPRFSLANERTFLAWVRTSLALLAGAAVFDAVDLRMPARLQLALGALLAVGGIVSAVQAWRGWVRTEAAMRRDRALPDNGTGLLVVVLVLVVATVLVGVIVGRAIWGPE